jgi:phenylalanyl-tRNA synthetase alpha chain
MDNLDQIVGEARSAFAATSDPDELEQVKARFLGKSGRITELLKSLGKLPPAEKKTAGAAINRVKEAVEARSTSVAKTSARRRWKHAWPKRRWT